MKSMSPARRRGACNFPKQNAASIPTPDPSQHLPTNHADLTLRPDGTFGTRDSQSSGADPSPRLALSMGDVLNDVKEKKKKLSSRILINPAARWYTEHTTASLHGRALPSSGCKLALLLCLRLTYWYWMTGATLLFVAVFTPFEVSFLDAPTSTLSGLFVLGRLIDGIFFLDMATARGVNPARTPPSRPYWVAAQTLVRLSTLAGAVPSIRPHDPR